MRPLNPALPELGLPAPGHAGGGFSVICRGRKICSREHHASGINHDEEDQGFSAARIDQGMGHIRTVGGGIARMKQVLLARGFNLKLAFDHGDEFPRSGEMSRTAQSAFLAEGHFIKLHVLLQIQRTQRADAAIPIGSIVKRPVIFPDHGHSGRGSWRTDQIAQRHAKGLGNPQGDRKRGIGLLALDLAEHGPADSTGA